MRYRGRFAPSPTGPLHFGSLVAAVGSWLRARSEGGTWLVRIEDIDPPRDVPGAAQAILDALAAFGMTPDAPPLCQSMRLDAYAVAFERLRAAGHVYPCWCSRAEVAARGGLHRGPCTAPPDPARAPAWRLRVGDTAVAFEDRLQGPQRQVLAEVGGDFVVKRVEGLYAYQLAVVVDDAAQGITEVVRGADLLDSTPRQIHLQRLLGLPTPAYLHLPLALDTGGRKLSKSEGALAVDPADPAPVLRAALAFLGHAGSAEAGSVATMLASAVRDFDVARLPHAQALPAPAVTALPAPLA